MRGSKCELAEEKTKRGGVRRRRSIKLSRRVNGVFAAHFCVEFSSGAKRVVMRVTGSPVTIMGKGPGVSFLPPHASIRKPGALKPREIIQRGGAIIIFRY